MTSLPHTIATTANADIDCRWLIFQRCWAIAILSLIAATWRLWLPTGEFPQVPLISLPVMTKQFDAALVISILISLSSIAMSKRPRRVVYVLVLIGFVLAIVRDQHRLQPWVYQAALHCIAFAGLAPRAARAWIMAVSISIYFYSACGKFDYQFLHTVGQDFVDRLLGAAEGGPTQIRLLLAACLPSAEVAIALAFCHPKQRRAAGIIAMAMHAVLIIMLGPWMLGHSTGVLLWNVWLLVLTWFLFVSPPIALPDHRPNKTATSMATALLLAALLLPISERAGYWDHWLSWSLYSPHTSRVELELHQSVLDELPKSAKPFIRRDEDADDWHALAIDRWSLKAKDVPIYPQARFQLGVAISIAKTLSDKNAIRVKVKSVSDRWTGLRAERWLLGTDEILLASRDFWLIGRQQSARTRTQWNGTRTRTRKVADDRTHFRPRTVSEGWIEYEYRDAEYEYEYEYEEYLQKRISNKSRSYF